MKPILFNTEMVRSILERRKTVTRRVVKPHNAVKAKRCEYRQGDGLWVDDTHIKDYSVSPCWIDAQSYIQKYAPYRPGDILYVRETFSCPYGDKIYYSADYEEHDIVLADKGNVSVSKNMIKWRPSIHMPREAARIFLRVTGVRVERLHPISDTEIMKEGVTCPWNVDLTDAFRELWNSTIKPADCAIYGWDANPWVFVISFERISKPEV